MNYFKFIPVAIPIIADVLVDADDEACWIDLPTSLQPFNMFSFNKKTGVGKVPESVPIAEIEPSISRGSSAGLQPQKISKTESASIEINIDESPALPPTDAAAALKSPSSVSGNVRGVVNEVVVDALADFKSANPSVAQSTVSVKPVEDQSAEKKIADSAVLNPSRSIDSGKNGEHVTTSDDKPLVKPVPTSNEDHLTFLLAELQGLENDLDEDDDIGLGITTAANVETAHAQPASHEAHQTAAPETTTHVKPASHDEHGNALSHSPSRPVNENAEKSQTHTEVVPGATTSNAIHEPEAIQQPPVSQTTEKPLPTHHDSSEPSKNAAQNHANSPASQEHEKAKPTPVETDDVKPLPQITPQPPTTPKPGMHEGLCLDVCLCPY